MMKIVINKCYGGFSLSRKAIEMMAKMQGRKCYFFETDFDSKDGRYIPAKPQKEGSRDVFWTAFDIPNPDEVLHMNKQWHKMTDKERQDYNNLWGKHSFDDTEDMDRSDPMLIEIVEKLGEEASGGCADLRVIEIPDGIEWGIEERDGMEWIAEKHRTWG
jgi:hypothetical protein